MHIHRISYDGNAVNISLKRETMKIGLDTGSAFDEIR